MTEDDICFRLRKRAEIRRQIPSRKSVQEGKPDRLADLLDEAADEIYNCRTEILRLYLENMKKIVHYDDAQGYKKFGDRVILYPIDHPEKSMVSNTTSVLTSNVIHIDKKTGIIETENSVYIPITYYPERQES